MSETRSLTSQLIQMGIEPVVFRAMQDMHPGANPNSIMMILRYCQASKLDPLRSPVVILPIDGKQVPVLSINGLRARGPHRLLRRQSRRVRGHCRGNRRAQAGLSGERAGR